MNIVQKIGFSFLACVTFWVGYSLRFIPDYVFFDTTNHAWLLIPWMIFAFTIILGLTLIVGLFIDSDF